MSENPGISCPGSVIYAVLTLSIGAVYTVKHPAHALFQFDASRTFTRHQLKQCFLVRDCLSLMPFVTHLLCLCLLLLFCCRRRQPQPQPATYHFPLAEKSRRFPTSPIGPSGANFPGWTPVKMAANGDNQVVRLLRKLLGCQVVRAIPCVRPPQRSTTLRCLDRQLTQIYHHNKLIIVATAGLSFLFCLPTRR